MPKEKPRYFTHASRFGDQTAYIVSKSASGFLIHKNGTKSNPDVYWNLLYCLSVTAAGVWKEITCVEARKLKDKIL